MALLKTDHIIKTFENWYICKCELCNDLFAITIDGRRKSYCSCSLSISKLNNKQNIVYILENGQSFYKIGLSSKSSLDYRIKVINEGFIKLNLKPFYCIKTLNIKSRSIAYSIERMLLYSFKDLKAFPIKPYIFEGQREIIKDLNIFALNNRIKTLISLFK
ncbi:hypothetical protein EPNKCIFM_00195 [Klebsiella phage KP13-16]|nr:hypothetical protein EPNKCIFM_00195 [Klebsiella phage KP13-16]HBT0444787.1 hypothetical protein [Klebsiella pneumoniae]